MKDITQLLHRARNGEKDAEELLLEHIHSELHVLASHFLLRERPDHTLQASALVNEAWIKLFGRTTTDWENRGHFYAAAAQTMRRILIAYARSRSAIKRSGNHNRVELTNALALVRERSDEFIALDEALEKLSEWDPRQAQIVNLRFYCGLTVEEIAAALGISPKTVKRDWSSARAWLHLQVRKVI